MSPITSLLQQRTHDRPLRHRWRRPLGGGAATGGDRGHHGCASSAAGEIQANLGDADRQDLGQPLRRGPASGGADWRAVVRTRPPAELPGALASCLRAELPRHGPAMVAPAAPRHGPARPPRPLLAVPPWSHLQWPAAEWVVEREAQICIPSRAVGKMASVFAFSVGVTFR
ncbi:hypothetical protein C2845_PM01G12400 [Panicum miliaceum]|uniref:Uncharacterized protein n=1 Tax=Panicum miliaceum TaxID=4540 RepID=A0A3L6TRC1_PANMI|nr:hypothetical protein C2845_PM01G12400 [Panicum miliaceum]